MRADVKKGILFAAALLGSAILVVALVIYILARSGVLEGLSHL